MMPTAISSTVDTALAYASRGWHVVPCHNINGQWCSCTNPDCHSPGKHPRTKNGLKDATTNAETIRDWLTKWPKANIAIRTGAISGVVAVDVDLPDGPQTIHALQQQHDELPASPVNITGSGGQQLIFEHPGFTVRNRTRLADGIDFRGDEGYIIVAPSNHVSGGSYHWLDGFGLDDYQPPVVPAWLLELIKSPERQRQESNGHTTPDEISLLMERATHYVARVGGAAEGQRNDAAFNAAGHLFAFVTDSGARLGDGQVVDLLRTWNYRNTPALSEAELMQCVDSAKANGTVREDKVVRPYQENGNAVRHGEPKEKPNISPIGVSQLIRDNPKLHESIIEGLLRRGETANIIAPPKTGKSWLAYHFALCVATGSPLFGLDGVCETRLGRVLIIDNELHKPTIAKRIPDVAEAMGAMLRDYADNLDVLPLRGKGIDLHDLARMVDGFERGRYDLVIADAFYRFIPAGVSENDNQQIKALYDRLDASNEVSQAAWINIHHASKGSQGEKSVTDVGAGAGSQARAADSHIVLREHQDEGVYVLEAAVRSFPPMEPIALKWVFPLWQQADDVDCGKLKGRLSRQEQKQLKRDSDGIDQVVAFLRSGPATARAIRKQTGFGVARCDRLLAMLIREDRIDTQDTKIRGNETTEYLLRGTDEADHGTYHHTT